MSCLLFLYLIAWSRASTSPNKRSGINTSCSNSNASLEAVKLPRTTKIFNITIYKELVRLISEHSSVIPVDSNKTCIQAISESKLARFYAFSTVNLDEIDEFTQFHPGYSVCNLREEKSCIIRTEEVCNGFSECLSDECGCAKGLETFYCGDSSGCIAIGQVCDGERDCLDGSDECVCDDYVNCVESFGEGVCINSNKRICLEKKKLVNTQKSQIDNCFPFIKSEYNALRKMCAHSHDVHLRQTFLDNCYRTCPGYKNHCNRVNWPTVCARPIEGSSNTYFVPIMALGSTNSYKCDNTTEPIQYLNNIDQVCNGKPDCSNGADEETCFNRFICADNNRSIHISKVCEIIYINRLIVFKDSFRDFA